MISRYCSHPGCPNLKPCPTHARPSASSRGYTSKRHRAARRIVLVRDPICTCKSHACHGVGPCMRLSTIADHYPLSREELLRMNVDPDDPERMRGLCASCHSRETNKRQGGGWH